MELAILIYAVETLTYNNTFFMEIFWWLFFITLILCCIKGGVSFYNQNQKVVHKFNQKKVKLEEGSVFTLEKPRGDLEIGVEYAVTSYFPYSNKIWCRGGGRNSIEVCGLKELEEVLTKQQPINKEVINPIKINVNKLPLKLLTCLMVLCLTLHTFLPSRQTAILMVGSYAVQQIATADKTKELGGKVYNMLSNQIDSWANEVPELKTLIGKGDE